MKARNNELDLKTALSYLVEGKYVPEEVLPTFSTEIEREGILDDIRKGSELEYDEFEDELFILKEDGSKIICPDLSEGVSNSSEWISDYLPEVNFDIGQAGNVRKSCEAESLYKLICLAVVIPTFKEEIVSFLKKYDFETMSGTEGGEFSSSFQCLESYQKLNSVRIDSILSSAGVKISSHREKSESFYTGLLSAEETLGLESIRRETKSVISEFEINKGLNPKEMATMSKIQKLKLIDERDCVVDTIISNSEYGILYRITKLNSERIPPVLKSKVFSQAEKVAEKEMSTFDGTLSEKNDFRENIRRKIVKESFRAIVKAIKAREIEKYKKDKSSYVLKTKS